MFKNLSKRERRLLAFTAAVVVAGLLYRAVILPKLRAMWRLEDRAETARIEVLEMERALALSERIEARYKNYEAAIAQEGSDLEESISFLKTVTGLLLANEMKRNREDQLPVQLGKYYKVFSVRLAVETRPVWLARFLAALEKSSRIIRIEDIKITALDDSENLAVNMKLTKVVAAGGTGQ